MNLFKKILFSLGLITLSFISLNAQGPYHQDVGNGDWVVLKFIRSIKQLKFADGSTLNSGFKVDEITLQGINDTIAFPELVNDYCLNTIYQIIPTGLVCDSVTITLQSKSFADSAYVIPINKRSFYPFKPNHLYASQYIYSNIGLKYQRFIVNWHSQTGVIIKIKRTYSN